MQDRQTAVIGQHPAERFCRVGVVEAQADPLAALQRDLAVDHRQAQIARRLKLPSDHAQALVPLVVPFFETNVAVVLGDGSNFAVKLDGRDFALLQQPLKFIDVFDWVTSTASVDGGSARAMSLATVAETKSGL